MTNFFTYLQKKINPLYVNSFILSANSVLSAALGFFFWILASRIYSIEDIGISVAIISSISLIALLARMGFDQSIIKYLPNSNKNYVIGTSLIISTILVVIIGLIFVIGIKIWSPSLAIIQSYWLIFLLMLIFYSILSILGTTLIALRSAQLYLYQNLFINSRILFIFLLVGLGVSGILISYSLSFLLACLFSVCVLMKMNIKPFYFNFEFLKKSFNFSIANHIISILNSLPTLILPIMILSLQGAETTSLYYISYTIVSILLIIPGSMSVSLFVEGANEKIDTSHFLKSFTIVFLALSLSILILLLFGEKILSFFGEGYNSAFNLLIILSFSSIFYAICSIYFSKLKIQKRLRELLYLNLVVFSLHIFLSYIFLEHFGLIGAGFAWIISYLICSMIIVYDNKKYFGEVLNYYLSHNSQ